MNDDLVLRELREIRFHLSLLTHSMRAEAFDAFESEVLKTDARIKMFHAIHNARNGPQIGDAAGVSRQAAHAFLKDLSDGGFTLIQHRATFTSLRLM